MRIGPLVMTQCIRCALPGEIYDDRQHCCLDQFEDTLSMSESTDTGDVIINSAAALTNAYSADVIDDADQSLSRDSPSCDLAR